MLILSSEVWKQPLQRTSPSNDDIPLRWSPSPSAGSLSGRPRRVAGGPLLARFLSVEVKDALTVAADKVAPHARPRRVRLVWQAHPLICRFMLTRAAGCKDCPRSRRCRPCGARHRAAMLTCAPRCTDCEERRPYRPTGAETRRDNGRLASLRSGRQVPHFARPRAAGIKRARRDRYSIRKEP